MAVRFALDNGLTVVFEEHHAARVAAFQVWVKAGSADERPDQSGLAHLHEHMLFKGTARRGLGAVAREIEAAGGDINAWTSLDETVYHVVIASAFARTGLDVLADAVRRSSFDAGELAREIEVVCEEIKRSLDQPARRASRALYAAAFQVHPYGRPVLGTEQSVRSFTREKMLEFYERHYVPQNLVLSVAGDLREGELRAWAQELLGGDWGRKHEGPAKRALEPKVQGRRVQLVEDPGKEAFVTVAFQCPAALHEDVPALDAMSMVLGQGDASRLSLEVKRRRGLASSVSAYAYTPLDPGILSLTLCAPPESAAAALEETLRVAMELTRSPVPREELAATQAIIESEAVYGRETVQGRARKMGIYEAGGGGLEEEARYYERVARLAPEEIQAVAAKYLALDGAVVSALLPSGRGLTREQVERAFERVGGESAGARAIHRPGRAAEPLPLRVTPRAKGESEVVVERLPSGATVLVREEASAPLFAIRASFLGGGRYEDDPTCGLTALWARGLVRGTATRSAEELSLAVQDLAGSLSASTGRNSVNVRGEFLSKHFRRAFELFADALNAPTFADAEVERERRIQLQDLITRDDKPSAVAFDVFSRTLFERHPYRLRLAGEISVVERLRPEDLRAYHAQHVDPSQLALAVVGDVRTDEVLALAAEAFGRSRGAARPPPQIPAEPVASAREGRRVLPSAQTHLVVGFPGARVTDLWRHALDVLSVVLSGQGGRLFVELRDKRSLAYSVTSYSVEGIDPGYFAVYLATSPEKAEAALEGIRGELVRVRDELLPGADLDRAIRNLIGTHEIGLQRNASRAGLLAVDHLFGIGLEKFAHYAERISSVTAEDVREVARRILDFDKVAIARVGPDGPAQVG